MSLTPLLDIDWDYDLPMSILKDIKSACKSVLSKGNAFLMLELWPGVLSFTPSFYYRKPHIFCRIRMRKDKTSFGTHTHIKWKRSCTTSIWVTTKKCYVTFLYSMLLIKCVQWLYKICKFLSATFVVKRKNMDKHKKKRIKIKLEHPNNNVDENREKYAT